MTKTIWTKEQAEAIRKSDEKFKHDMEMQAKYGDGTGKLYCPYCRGLIDKNNRCVVCQGLLMEDGLMHVDARGPYGKVHR